MVFSEPAVELVWVVALVDASLLVLVPDELPVELVEPVLVPVDVELEDPLLVVLVVLELLPDELPELDPVFEVFVVSEDVPDELPS